MKELSDEEKLLIAKLNDAARLAEKRNCPIFTDFLSPAQQAVALRVATTVKDFEFRLWGGYEGAERAMGVFLPDWCVDPEFPILCLELKTRGEYPVHPEILGALTGLGVRREKIGDIITSTKPPMLFCDSSIAPFLTENFTKAGRKAFRAEPTENPQAIPEAEHEIKTFTVPSMRLDCIAAEGFGVARTKMTEHIRNGGVALNWEEALSPSASVEEGDTISVRGKGRLIVTEIGGTSRKDRIFLTVKRFITRK